MKTWLTIRTSLMIKQCKVMWSGLWPTKWPVDSMAATSRWPYHRKMSCSNCKVCHFQIIYQIVNGTDKSKKLFGNPELRDSQLSHPISSTIKEEDPRRADGANFRKSGLQPNIGSTHALFRNYDWLIWFDHLLRVTSDDLQNTITEHYLTEISHEAFYRQGRKIIETRSAIMQSTNNSGSYSSLAHNQGGNVRN